MTTDISPVLGPTLTGMIEVTAFAVLVSGGVTGFFLWRSLRQNRKIASARLVLELQRKWDGKSEFARLVGKLEKRDADFSRERDIRYVLGVFEDLAVLWRDGTLTKTHVRESFGRDIVRIGANESIRKIMVADRKKDPKNTYNNLVKMLEYSKKWGMDPLLT